MVCIWRGLVIAAMAGIFGGGALAQTVQPDDTKFDQIGQQIEKEQAAPGFAYLVWSHGKVVFAKGYGFADVASKTSATPDTRFAIGSISKQFTAACVLKLAQQGKFSLDDKLAKFVPGMPNADKITLRMLLNQDSGLHNFPNTREQDWPLKDSIPPEKILDILKTDKPDFAPGEKWEYSNTNYAVLAYIVARISGMSYPEFLQKNIFGPLGMTSSGSGFAAQANAATPYEGNSGHFSEAKPRISLDLFYGAGSIVSTAQDLARCDAALMEGKLLNPSSMQDLWTNGKLPSGTPINYAMGFIALDNRGHREVWHNGYAPNAGGYCYNAIFPDDKLAVVVLSNASQDSFRGKPEQIVQSVLALYDPKVAEPAGINAGVQDDPTVHALALKMWDQFSSGKLDRSLLSPEMNAAMTTQLLDSAGPQLQSMGKLRSISLLEKTAMEKGTNYIYAAQFGTGDHKIQIFVTKDGKVGGYRLLP
jgi:D-alanyl-D-alanine carboxypeptidase